MELPGLVTVQTDQTDLIDELARMVGTCFREEMWYVTWLDALDVSEDRKLAITQEVLRSDFLSSVAYGCVYTTPDHAGATNALLRSELEGLSWPELEELSNMRTAASLTQREIDALLPRSEAMEPLSDNNWPQDVAAPEDDFIYFVSVGVDPTKRGSGAFGRLFRPFLAYADEHHIDCYLDCYTDRLEQLYAHYGFEVVARKSAPGFDIVERCMVRRPH